MQQSRRLLVLRAVVEDYIRSQEPVGSNAIAHRHDLGVSSATVRNDMAALEDEGYLTQPHTSAGRVPTEKGYRYFVDQLATVVPLSAAQRRGIGEFLSGSANLQDTLQRAARLLAQITGQVAVIASPSLSKSSLRHMELVPVAMNVLLAVVVTDTGRVAQHTLPVSTMPSTESISRFTEALNASCSGLSLAQAAQRMQALEADPRFTSLKTLTVQLERAFVSMADDENASELYMSGASHLAHQRSTADLAPLFDALEEQVVLMKLMSALSEESLRGDGVNVAIGSETHTPGLLNAAVVTSGYGHAGHVVTQSDHADDERDESGNGDGVSREHNAGETDKIAAANKPDVAVVHDTAGEPVAFVGSIGLTHMDYATTISAVHAVARYLTSFLAHEEIDG